MFKDIFSNLIQSRGVTAYKLSKDTGISESLISHWKSGRQLPKFESLNILADYFNVTVDYLMERQSNDSETDNLKKMLDHNYADLNVVGRERLVHYSDDLVSSSRYQPQMLLTVARSADNHPPEYRRVDIDLSTLPSIKSDDKL